MLQVLREACQSTVGHYRPALRVWVFLRSELEAELHKSGATRRSNGGPPSAW